jgi:hypothetical protein
MKKNIAFLSLLLLSFLAIPARASEDLDWAVLTGFESWHSDNRDDLNPHNTGIGIRTPGGWTAGTYYNSIRRWSVYAGHEWQWKMIGTDDHAVRLGAVAGAVSGYKGGVKALVLPELMMVWKPVELGIIVIPRYTKDPVTVSAQLRYNF